MAKITNPSKLLASSKSSSITKIGKSNILAKTSPLSKGLLATRQSKDASDANNKLVNIDKFLKSDLIVSQKKAEVKRKGKEKQDFDDAEKKLETPKLKGFKFPSLGLPSLGFFDRVKRFLFFTALGWLLPKIIEFLPKLEGFAKIVGGIYKFAEGLFGNLFNGFMSLVKFGGDLKDKTLGFIASAKVGVGGNYQKEFDKLEKQFNTFANASIIAGLVGLDMGLAGLDEFNKQRKKGQKPVAGKPAAKAGAKVTTGKGGEKPSGKPKVTTGKGGKVPGWWNRIFKGPFAKLKGPLSRFAGAAVPGLGAVVGAADAKARFAAGDKIGGALASVSAGLDTITAILALTGVGLPAAAIFGSVSMGIDVILLINDIGKVIKETLPMMGWLPTFKGGGKVVKRYQGGGTTRGGRPVGGPKRRTITPTRRKPPRVTIPKTQPGKDVGGEKKVKEFYAKPEDPNKKYTAPAGGWLANLGKERQDLSAFDTLKKMSGTLKSDETLAKGILGVMSSGIDMALGQKPDKKVFKSFFDSIGYIADTLASQRAGKSMSSLRSQIGAFAEGGTVPSRGLRGTYIDANTGDMLAKLIGPTIDQRVNEAIQSIEKQLQMKGTAGPGAGAGPDAGGAGGGGGGGGQLPGSSPPEVKAMLEAISGAEGGWESVNPSTTVPGLKNMTIAEARLAAIQKGIREKGGSGAMGKFQQMPDYILERARDSGLDPYKDKFNEENQTRIARMLMASVYPGGESQLIKDAQKDPLVASSKLRGTWPSLPGGTQENVHTRGFLRRYNESLKVYQTPQSTGTAKSLAEAAASMKGFSTAAGPEGGNKACVWAVNQVFKKAGIRTPWGSSNYVPTAEQSMISSGYVRVGNGEQRPGDLYIVNGQEHIGIVLSNGNIISNSSSGAKFSWEASTSSYESAYGGTGKFYRMPAPPKPTEPVQPKPSTGRLTLEQARDLERRSVNLKLGDKPITVPGIGNIQMGKDFFGNSKKKYYNKDGTEITQQQFNDLMKKYKLPEGSQVGSTPTQPDISRKNMQGGGLISPSKPNRTIPNSFASYETPGGGMMIAIQPMIIEKQVPVSGGGGKMIAFPVPVAVNSNMDLSLSRG